MATISLCCQFPVNLVVFYRPPGEVELDGLDTFLTKHDAPVPTLLLGDFNLLDIVWSRGVGTVKPTSKRTSFYQQAIDLFRGSDLTQLIEDPTHIKGNTLDLVFISTTFLDDFNVQCKIMPGLSDHNVVLVGSYIQNLPSKRSKEITKKKFNFRKADYQAISGLFENCYKSIKSNDYKSVTKK